MSFQVLHTSVAFPFTVIKETTETTGNKMGNEKERDEPFQQQQQLNTANANVGAGVFRCNVPSGPSDGAHGGNDLAFCELQSASDC